MEMHYKKKIYIDSALFSRIIKSDYFRQAF